MKTFALKALQWVKHIGQGHSPNRGFNCGLDYGLEYQLILGPLVWECPYPIGRSCPQFVHTTMGVEIARFGWELSKIRAPKVEDLFAVEKISTKHMFAVEKISTKHMLVPWANILQLVNKLWLIWHMDNNTPLIKLNECKIGVLSCAKLFGRHQWTKLKTSKRLWDPWWWGKICLPKPKILYRLEVLPNVLVECLMCFHFKHQ